MSNTPIDPSSIPKSATTEFVPLDTSELNDMRRRIVANEEVPDEEIRRAIQTKLYEARQQLASENKPAKTSKKLDPNVNFDDLLNG